MKFQVKYLFLILIIATIFPLSIKSQSTFMKTFGDTSETYKDIGYSIIETDKGNYIAVGSYGASNHDLSTGDIYIVMIDDFGNQLWNKRFGSSTQYEIAHSILSLSDNSYMIKYNQRDSRLRLLKITNNGDSLFTKSYSMFTNYGKNFNITSDGGIITIGSFNSNITLLKLDSQGDSLWMKTYGVDSLWVVGYSVQQTNDKGFIICGVINGYEYGSKGLWLIKTDEFGDILWTKNFMVKSNGNVRAELKCLSVIQTIDEGYFISATKIISECYACELRPRGWLIKTDSKGDTLWTSSFEQFTDFRSGIQTSDGGYVAVGDFYPNFMLVKLDTNGKLEWKQEIGNNSYKQFVGWDVKETKDKGFITTGEIRRQSSRYYDLFILKVNKDGILVGVKDEEKTIPTQFYLKQNYPNPFNPTTILEVSIAEAGFFSLDVYNSLGEKVTNIVSKNLDRGVHKYTFDASNLSSGVYFYRLTGNNINLIKKMVLIH
ncbi:MAG: T9SS type A sorting domain-containing protein [Melioribacteraceae bacterium]|nr:T9SS type A sorting domain-containing protein [Melioribacteraceae bacterium]